MVKVSEKSKMLQIIKNTNAISLIKIMVVKNNEYFNNFVYEYFD